MSSQTIIWTAVPNGVKNGKLQVSVLVSPRLTGNAKTTTLAEFPSFLDWPATLATQKWTVRYGNTVTPATVVGDKPSSQYWKALFPASTPVNSFNFVDNTAKPIHSYDVAEVHGFIRKQYAQVAEQHPEAPPPTEILTTQAYLAPIGYYGGLDASPSEPTPEEKLFTEIHTTVQKNIFMAKTPILQNGQINADAARLNFAAVKGFFVRQASAGSAIRKVTPKPAPPVLDFHQQVASLGSLPVIMRRVGLVIDLEFTLPPTAPAASTVNVEVTAPAATTNTTPKTAIEMPAFLPAPDPAGSDVKSGMLVLSPPNYQLISLDVEGAALNLIEFSTMLQRRMERKLLRSERQTIAFRDMAVRHGLCSPDQVQTFSPTVAQLMKVSQKAAILAMANQEPVDEQGLPAIYASGLAVTKNERAKFTYFGFKRALELEAGIIGNRNILRTAVVEAPVAGAVRPGAARQLLRPRIGGAVEPASAVAGEKILYASDLVRGYAVDVWDNQTKKWHSVCQRTGTYKFIDPSAPPISGVTDEGFIQLAASSDPNTKELFVNDAIIRWTGWSLAVERPGKSLDNKGQMTKYDPAANTASTGIKVVPTFTVPPGSLPRLRYGTTYRIRARIVDLAGNTLAMDSPQANAANVATGDYLYGRYNPLGSPDLTYCADPKPAESVDTLVIRSNYNTPTLEPDTRRYVTPPVSDQMTAEQYGKFDGPNTMLQDSKGNKTYTVLSTHEGTLRDLDKSKMTADPVRGEKPVIIPSGQLTALPYLPDPIVTGVSLRNLPAGAQMAVQVVTFDAASIWFDA